MELTGTPRPGRASLGESRAECQGRGVDGGAQGPSGCPAPLGFPDQRQREASGILLAAAGRAPAAFPRSESSKNIPKKGKMTSLSKKNN